MGVRLIVGLVLLFAACPNMGWAAQLTGIVDNVEQGRVRIVLDDASHVQKGDAVTLEGEVAGLGWLAIDGTWLVVEVGAGFVVADLDGEASGRPQPGYRARITATGEPAEPELAWDPRIDEVPEPQTPWLGVDTIETRPPGVLVSTVVLGSPAELAGVRAGDRLLDLDGKAVDAESLSASLARSPIGEAVPVRVQRDGGLVDLQVVLVPEPPEITLVKRAGELIRHKRYDEAREMLQGPAEGGHPEARATLAWMSLNGWGGPQDDAAVMRLCTSGKRPASQGCGLVLCELMTQLMAPPAAEAGCRRAAASGVPMAQERLGYALAHGAGVPKDTAEAASWLHRAATSGLTGAEIELGLLTERGDGVRKDPEKALRLYRSAAQTGNPVAQYNVARCLHFGIGTAADPAQAVRWYHEAAAAGFPPAQSDLGVMLVTGRGTVKDPDRAAYWFEQAARAGNVDAQYNLGRVYLFGEGRAEDPAAARYWLELAADQGHGQAAELLAAIR